MPAPAPRPRRAALGPSSSRAPGSANDTSRETIRRRETNTRKTSPQSATASPTGVKSNILKGSPVLSARKVATTMFGGVPIAVTSPPSRLANDSGIRSCDGGRFAFLASRRVTGSISASAPMLFMNADSSIVIPQFAASWRTSVPRARDRSFRNSSTTPEPCSA